MLTLDQTDALKNAFPQLGGDDSLLKLLRAHCTHVTPKAGETLCLQGNRSNALPLVISGMVRVFKISESGKEITLYHIVDGESCVLTTASILADTPFPAEAQTDSDTRLVLLPAASVTEWISRFPVWQRFIFQLVAQRMAEVITVVEEVAFQRMDRRIANFLMLQKASDDGAIHITHQAIAAEIGTAREVVTRVLRDLERKGILALKRGRIRIVNPVALQQLSLGFPIRRSSVAHGDAGRRPERCDHSGAGASTRICRAVTSRLGWTGPWTQTRMPFSIVFAPMMSLSAETTTLTVPSILKFPFASTAVT